jgi:large subunit ribosomal protein L24
VRVITGKDKGKEGVIDSVLPKDGKVIVTGVNIASKHQRPGRKNQQAGIIDKDMPIDASNVMFVHKGKTVRLGYSIDKKGEKVRVARPSGEEV